MGYKSSIGQIAKKVGIKKASVYYYFRFKEEILMELVKYLYHSDETDQSFDKIKDKKAFEKYVLNEGYSLINAFENNPKARRVFAEIDIQTNRIPKLKEHVGNYDRRSKEKWQMILKYGKTIQAVPQDLDISSHADFIFAVLTGLDDAMLYEYNIEVKKVWCIAMKSIMLGGKNGI